MTPVQLKPRHLGALIGILLLSGCAAVGQQSLANGSPAGATTLAAASDAQDAGTQPTLEPDAGEREQEIVYGQFPPDILERVILAEMAGQRGLNERALEEYSALAYQTGDVNIIARAARVAAYLRRPEASVELAQLWLQRDPDAGEAHQTLAFQFLGLGRYEESIEHLRWLLEQGHAVDFRAVTSRLASDGKAPLVLGSLVGEFEDLVETWPDNPSLRMSLAQLYQLNNKPRQALQQLRALKGEAAQNPDVIIQQVQLLETTGEARQAERLLQGSLETSPRNAELRFLYARRLIEQQNYDAARRQFAILVEQDPHDSDMLYSLALINMELGDLRQARGYFERLSSSPRRRDDAHFYLASIHQRQDDVDQAIVHYLQVDGGGNFLEAQRKLSELMIRQGRYDELRERLGSIRQRNAEFALPLLAMEASVLMDERKLDAAGSLLDDGLQRHPDNTQLLYLRSVLYQEQDDLAAMERDLRRLIELEPENPVAYNTLGYILADRTMRYEEAHALILRAIALAPDDPAIIDSLGWVQYRLGQYDEALKNLDRAFALFPDHEVAAHLGEVLWVTGEQEAATRIWREALREQPDSAPIRDAMQRLLP